MAGYGCTCNGHKLAKVKHSGYDPFACHGGHLFPPPLLTHQQPPTLEDWAQ